MIKKILTGLSIVAVSLIAFNSPSYAKLMSKQRYLEINATNFEESEFFLLGYIRGLLELHLFVDQTYPMPPNNEYIKVSCIKDISPNEAKAVLDKHLAAKGDFYPMDESIRVIFVLAMATNYPCNN